MVDARTNEPHGWICCEKLDFDPDEECILSNSLSYWKNVFCCFICSRWSSRHRCNSLGICLYGFHGVLLEVEIQFSVDVSTSTKLDSFPNKKKKSTLLAILAFDLLFLDDHWISQSPDVYFFTCCSLTFMEQSFADGLGVPPWTTVETCTPTQLSWSWGVCCGVSPPCTILGIRIVLYDDFVIKFEFD